ncbi:MAG: helix-turn-helix domain-containing protein [Candidatus Promineifilaceae bacterium]|nr:helix-turn-helix domain-containing protein [Candidatus Promineifilaceae bacterium]
MVDLLENDGDLAQWLPLGQAAERLGVHSTTLRRWADNGVIPFLLTPGGHRRFTISDLDAFQSMRRQRRPLVPVEEAWAEKAMTRTRRALAEPEAESWLANMADDHRLRHRRLGRQLMGLTLQYVSTDEANGHILEKAREIGHEYGRISKEINLPLTEALQAALYFRDELIEVALQLPESTRIRLEDNLRLMRRINVLLNAVHLGIAEIFEQSQ